MQYTDTGYPNNTIEVVDNWLDTTAEGNNGLGVSSKQFSLQYIGSPSNNTMLITGHDTTGCQGVVHANREYSCKANYNTWFHSNTLKQSYPRSPPLNILRLVPRLYPYSILKLTMRSINEEPHRLIFNSHSPAIFTT